MSGMFSRHFHFKSVLWLNKTTFYDFLDWHTALIVKIGYTIQFYVWYQIEVSKKLIETFENAFLN